VLCQFHLSVTLQQSDVLEPLRVIARLCAETLRDQSSMAPRCSNICSNRRFTQIATLEFVGTNFSNQEVAYGIHFLQGLVQHIKVSTATLIF
jgi:hypothetical protein